MAKSDNKPPEQKPTPTQEAVDDLLWEIPFARPIWKFFVREGKAVKHGWVAVAVIVAIVVFFTHRWTEGDVDAKILTATNYFGGVLAKKESDISALKGQLAEAKEELNKCQLTLTPYQALTIAKLGPEPIILGLTVNGINIPNVDTTPGAVVSCLMFPINKTNIIIINLVNRSKMTAANPVLRFSAEIDPTNIMTDGWQLEPKSDDLKNHWHQQKIVSLPQQTIFQLPPLKISPNFKCKSVEVRFLAVADNSTSFQFCVDFIFNNDSDSTNKCYTNTIDRMQ
jgi:hypothetical protein